MTTPLRGVPWYSMILLTSVLRTDKVCAGRPCVISQLHGSHVAVPIHVQLLPPGVLCGECKSSHGVGMLTMKCRTFTGVSMYRWLIPILGEWYGMKTIFCVLFIHSNSALCCGFRGDHRESGCRHTTLFPWLPLLHTSQSLVQQWYEVSEYLTSSDSAHMSRCLQWLWHILLNHSISILQWWVC